MRDGKEGRTIHHPVLAGDMMKRIAVIDIHPQNPMCRAHLASGEFDKFGNDTSAVYLFRNSGREYTYENTLNYDSLADLRDIDAFYLSIPANMLDFRILKVPFSDKEKITRILPLELDNLVMGGSRTIVFDSIVVGGDETSWDVLVIYIQKEILTQVLAEFSQKNVDPRVVTSLDLDPMVNAGKDSEPGISAENLVAFLIHPRNWEEKQRIAAAQKELSAPHINLRTGPFSYRKDAEKTGKVFKMAAVLAFLLVLVIHANLLFQTVMAKKEAAALAKEMSTSYRQLFPDEKKTMDKLYQMKSHMREITEKENELSGVGTLQFLLELSKDREANVIYTDISIEKRLIKMKAEAPSLEDLDKTKRKLTEFLPSASISDVRPESSGKVLFTVVAKDSTL